MVSDSDSNNDSKKYAKTYTTVIDAALDAVDPIKATKQFLKFSDNNLIAGNVEYLLALFQKVFVLGFGKASQSMAAGLYEILGSHISNGVVVVKQNEIDTSLDTGPVEVIEGSHPTPDSRSVDAANRIKKLALNVGPADLVIVLISGGASSLLTLPASDVSLEDLQQTTNLLLRSGADIEQLNTVRRHLSAIKGGRLAQIIAPAKVLSLILSDVVGDDISAIGSGPTAPDESTYEDAWHILEEYKLIDELADSITSHLSQGMSGEVEDTPTTSSHVFEKVQNEIIASNKHAAVAAVSAAETLGFDTKLVTTTLTGEAKDIGQDAAKTAIELKTKRQSTGKPQCLIYGGETTVTLTGNGKGGRNQELVLAAAIKLDGAHDLLIVSFATDGTDGPTDSAGAVISGQTCNRARKLNLNPTDYLNNNDSYSFFEQLEDHIITGPTRTNVADLLMIFAL